MIGQGEPNPYKDPHEWAEVVPFSVRTQQIAAEVTTVGEQLRSATQGTTKHFMLSIAYQVVVAKLQSMMVYQANN